MVGVWMAGEIAAAEEAEFLRWYFDTTHPVGDYSGCIPLGFLLDPEGDDDESSGRCFEGGRDDDEDDEDCGSTAG